ncbi:MULTISPECIES: FAD-dependent monooxygenase [unclassified Rathayibacter]|uniref:FAD-dependent monooxygenase n=1 Tax=unclassified Rathayibacter TaxID=2609250 RepID=UPI00104A2CB0|nr:MULTISPECIES: FAD-dependent monooxygenase [unclassified Rathayibacter]TCL77880.1 2-polyprenyl-6-methoxyphenol hydroxylase-like FAD-dependent oxidoreductase [Rathayibacter sp. PhB192]TCM23777.1 2-polyprenyl-6-methoxyphenol hydroxylase-like FAD-dependent oxidoreductase [Rathayibacter sp. PhB179]
MSERTEPLHAIVVGGSLAGLAASLALAAAGVRITVIERADARPRSGGAVGVNQDHLERVTGLPPRDLHRASSAPESWTGLHGRLRQAAEQSPLVHLIDRTSVRDVHQSPTAVEVHAGGRTMRADLLIGADGHRSIVRRAVAPHHPDAAYAGYVLWLGIAREDELPATEQWPDDADILDSRDAVLIGYPLEGEDGHRRPGSRRLGWAWFDPTRNDLLRRQGALHDGVVMHSIRSTDVPERTLQELHRDATQWPQPWRDAIRRTIRNQTVTGTPIAEYVPQKIVEGRIALTGNAAHVPTPMTGRGFDVSLDDASALASAIQDATPITVPSALQQYETERLDAGRAMVRAGQSFSEWFGRH